MINTVRDRKVNEDTISLASHTRLLAHRAKGEWTHLMLDKQSWA